MSDLKNKLVKFGNYLFSDERAKLLKESGNSPLNNKQVSDADIENFLADYDEPKTGLSFGQALDALKAGKKVARIGWNGANMFAYLVPGSTFKVDRRPLLGIYEEGTEVNYRPHIDLKTADGSIATWSPSGSDSLAEDWVILD